MRLLSFEVNLVAFYMKQNAVVRTDILQQAQKDPQASAPLINAYRLIDTLV